jgi:hypothetical protein
MAANKAEKSNKVANRQPEDSPASSDGEVIRIFGVIRLAGITVTQSELILTFRRRDSISTI